MGLYCVGISHAQFYQSEIISTNNISARFFSNGMVSFDGNNPHFAVPKDSGTHALFAGCLWIGGFDDTYGVLHASFMRFDDSLTNFRPGPIANNYSGVYQQRYDKVWKVTQQQIDYHRQHFTDVNYAANSAILDWPANGNVANGEPAVLAPFADYNNNLVYEPGFGEHPIILGDEALYIIYSDRFSPNSVNCGNPLNVDVHLMVYAYTGASAPAIRNTLFMHYNIVNRNADGYHDLLIGSWSDFDLGDFSNDRVGCDTSLNSYFVYNASIPDVGMQGIKGYGYTKPAFGIKFLNTPLHSFAFFQNGATSNYSDPVTPFQHYNIMDAIWPDGVHFNWTDLTGYVGGQFNHMFPGSPCDSTAWSEVNITSITAGDRRALGSSGKHSLPAGSNFCFDMAYVFANGNLQASCIADAVDSLGIRMRQVQTFYNYQADLCDKLSTSIVSLNSGSLLIYPNPASDKVTLVLPEEGIYNVQLSDINGRVVLSRFAITSKYTFNTSHLAPGVYMLVAENLNRRITGKVVIQK